MVAYFQPKCSSWERDSASKVPPEAFFGLIRTRLEAAQPGWHSSRFGRQRHEGWHSGGLARRARCRRPVLRSPGPGLPGAHGGPGPSTPRHPGHGCSPQPGPCPAGGPASPGRGTQSGPGPAHRPQRQPELDRPAHDLRFKNPEGLHRPLRRHRGPAPAAGRRRARGQGQHGRVRHGLQWRIQRLRRRPESLGHQPRPRGQQQRLHRLRGRRLRAPGPGQRHGRLRAPASLLLQRDRPAAHLRRAEPLRPGRHGLQHGSGGPRGRLRRGPGSGPQRHGRPGSPGQHLPAPARRRAPGPPSARPPSGAAHRAAGGILRRGG